MPLSQIVNNIGVGKDEGTFLNLTTTLAAASATPFTQANVDLFRRACSIVGSNYVGQGTTTMPLLGAVLALSEDLVAGKVWPLRCVVQVTGFAEIEGTTGPAGAITAPLAAATPGWHLMQRQGCVAQETTTYDLSMGYGTRGQLTEVFDTDRCVVLF